MDEKLKKIIERIDQKINDANKDGNDATYWYRCGLHDAKEIIKKDE